MALFRDWRSPGEKWIRTDFGWRRLAEIRNSLNQQLRRQFSPLSSNSSSKASSTSSSKKVSRATSPQFLERDTKELKLCKVDKLNSKSCSSKAISIEETEKINKQVKHLNGILDQRCVRVTVRSSSKESSHYSTIADAINKLNFEEALNNDGCFPLICEVLTLVFELHQSRLSGTMQNTLLRLMDRVKDICIVSNKHTGLVIRLMESAVPSLERIRQQQFSSFGVRNIDAKIKTVLKMKRQLQSSLCEENVQTTTLELLDLPIDCIQHIASFLTHPKDLLNFGAANMTLLQITDDNFLWRGLTVYHYGIQIKGKPRHMDWKSAFITQYSEQNGQLKLELSAAVCLCKTCHFVFWKPYGHPCLSAREGEPREIRPASQHQHLTPEQFLQLFVV